MEKDKKKDGFSVASSHLYKGMYRQEEFGSGICLVILKVCILLRAEETYIYIYIWSIIE